MQTELEPVSASPEQLATANLLFYTHLVTTFDHEAGKYARFRINNGGGDEDEYHQQAQTVLEDLYFAGQDPEKLNNFENDWGESAEFFRSQLNRIKPQLEKKKQDFLAKAPSFGFAQRAKLAFTLGNRLASNIPHDQKLRILEMAGYPKEERFYILKKLAISAGLSTLSSVVYTGASGLLMFEGSQSLGLNNPNLQLATILSYIAHYSAFAVNSAQNLRMLNNPEIHNSTNVALTAVYYLLEKLTPDKKLRNSIASMFILLPFIGLEIAWFTGVAAQQFDQGAQIGRNSSLGVLLSVESGMIEAFINGKEKKKQ